MYSIEGRIRFSEIDSEGKLSPEGIVNYLQDCSTFHCEDSGVGIGFLKEHSRAWILTSWQVVIDKYPVMSQRIKVTTNPYHNDRFFAYRNFAIIDESGEIMVKANSIWVYVDTQKNRPVRLSDADIEPFLHHGVHEDKLDMEYAPRKLRIPSGGKRLEPILVMPHHIDTNNHVNNGQYIRFASEYLPPYAEIREFRAEYKTAAKLNDVIIPEITEDGMKYFVALRNEAGDLYASTEFFIV